jgi:hypothetical protein
VQILYATEATPGQVNEDFVITGPTWAIVLDGASQPRGVDTGCIHDVPWYVRHLGTELARRLTLSPNEALEDALASAIAATSRLHEHTCDLSNPDSPSTTVVAIRQRDAELDYLTLADSLLIADVDGDIRAVTDRRTAQLADYSTAGVRAARNSPDGFYVASTMPGAAYKAVQGTLPTSSIRRAALLSDGAARLVDRFHLMDWHTLLDLLDFRGPSELISQTRQAELAEPDGKHTTRGKKHDDVTAVLATRLEPVHS